MDGLLLVEHPGMIWGYHEVPLFEETSMHISNCVYLDIQYYLTMWL